MSWFKSTWVLLPLSSLLFAACTQTTNSEVEKVYFDLEGYFNKEVAQLVQNKPSIQKIVWKNGEMNQKEIQDLSWDQELSLFIESDINKPSWLHSYAEEQAGDTLQYSTQDSSLEVRNISIIGTPPHIREIHIHRRVENPLYTSDTQLSYYPDSLYRMEKTQNVRFLGENQYRIEGQLK